MTPTNIFSGTGSGHNYFAEYGRFLRLPPAAVFPGP